MEVRSDHVSPPATSTGITLATDASANRIQTCCNCLSLSPRPSAVVPRRQLPSCSWCRLVKPGNKVEFNTVDFVQFVERSTLLNVQQSWPYWIQLCFHCVPGLRAPEVSVDCSSQWIMPFHCRRPRIPCGCRADIEQFTTRRRVVTIAANVQASPQDRSVRSNLLVLDNLISPWLAPLSYFCAVSLQSFDFYATIISSWWWWWWWWVTLRSHLKAVWIITMWKRFSKNNKLLRLATSMFEVETRQTVKKPVTATFSWHYPASVYWNSSQNGKIYSKIDKKNKILTKTLPLTVTI